MSYPVTELQLAILDALWALGEASVVEIHDELRGGREVSQATINTLLGRLEERGFVRHREEGRRNLYEAAVERRELRRSLVEGFLQHTRPLFRRDMGLLVSHLLSAGAETPEDFDEIRELLAELEERARREAGG